MKRINNTVLCLFRFTISSINKLPYNPILNFIAHCDFMRSENK